MSQSRRIKQIWSFQKTGSGKLITHNEKLVLMYLCFQVNLLRGIWQSRRMKKTWEINAFLKTQDVAVKEN